jgi:glucose-6-phosphate dehydrogenase assembly protein OpcA
VAATVSGPVTDAAGREVLGGGGVLPVDVAALGAELRRLWEAAGDGDIVTRACTRNVIALCADDEAAALAGRVLAAVADRYPSRAFVIRRDADAPDRLDATLEAQCQLRDDERHVCCEQITLAVGSAAARRAASAIVPLLEPDLPVFVWPVGAFDPDEDLLDRLLDHADRLLFDSRSCTDAPGFLRDLAGRAPNERWSAADLEWTRLDDWREAVAALFDDPATRALPPELARVVVRRGEDAAIAAALLAGWILDRVDAARSGGREGLGARVEAGDGAGEEAPIAVVFEPAAAALPGIRRVTLETRRPAATLSAELGPDGREIRLRIAAPDACALPARLPHADAPVEHLVEAQLARPAADALYEAALARATTFLAGSAPD